MARHTALITAGELLGQLAQVRVVDCSHDLGDTFAGARQYAEGHIPGAVHAHLDEHLSGAKTGTNGRHPLPEAGALVRWLGAQGVAFGAPVVAYDRSGGMYAARLWWLLRWLGHRQVRVLDGGWQAWVAACGAVSTEAPRHEAMVFEAPVTHDHLWVDARFVERNLHSRDALLVDARGAERYAGTVEPIDPRAGHIPGAVNRPFTDNLGPDGHFKPADLLATEWRAVLGAHRGDAVVAQCGSGVTACHNLLAMEIADLPMGRLYAGSWSEWCADPRRPIAAGRD
ncbi:sulfurtransferase [Hydrogenophaga sp. OTU3427]|uniref:sulfurtransferase n=1 Tax=Hydrogenophaga sp. OTU3427 TaxID=3043856 RepID=UPI00313C4F8C